MNTKFTSDYIDFASCLTSQIEDITLTTNYTTVAVSLYRTDEADNPIFTTSLYAVDNTVVISDVADLIEADMRSLGISTGSYVLSVAGVTLNIGCIYCDYLLPSDLDTSEAFLSTLETSVVHADSIISVTTDEAASGVCYVRYIDQSGMLQLYLLPQLSTSGASNTYSASVASLIAAIPSDVNYRRIVSFTLDFSLRCKTFYLLDDTDWMLFRFRNIFNAVEYIDLSGTVTTKTVVDVDSAVIGGVMFQYDHLTTRTYEVSTAAMTEAQARSIDQLFNSREIDVCDCNGSFHRIIVTDHTCEISDDDESLATVKFTWRYASRRPRLSDDDTAAFRPSPGIFTSPFTLPFD